MNIYTIGCTKKSAEQFFSILQDNNVKKVIDVRLNNSNQLAAFSKSNDLKFFLGRISNIEYLHELMFAPTKDLLDKHKKGLISWDEYKDLYIKLLNERNIKEYINNSNILCDGVCFLCSESKGNRCHRMILVDYIKQNINIKVKINHL
ncbi:TPA: DUF488 domain-containing protein [Clostridioides difficile]|nr:DUF488 domain-containing protein [Clostridioides difficile]HDJ1470942.1 DUF488 domain-containing protein [Clostridioides difficile]